MEGVLYGYTSIVNYINKNYFDINKPVGKGDYDIDRFNDIFIGSRGRMVTKYNVLDQDDILLYYSEYNRESQLIHNEETYPLYSKGTITYNGRNYNNDYQAYIRAFGVCTISNEESLSDKKLLIIGESFDNSLIPLLTQNFSKIYSYDLRNLKKSLRDEINLKNPDLVLVLYNSQVLNNPKMFAF